MWAGILGTFLALGYTGDPVRLGYKGFGEVAIALGFGPVMVMGFTLCTHSTIAQ